MCQPTLGDMWQTRPNTLAIPELASEWSMRMTTDNDNDNYRNRNTDPIIGEGSFVYCVLVLKQ